MNDKARLMDLIRYQRSELYKADLITDDEYVELCLIKNSPLRLQTYDSLIDEIKALKAEIVELKGKLNG